MNPEIEKEDEIDLLALLMKIWQGKKTILKYSIIFLLIGIFIAIFSKKEYTATSMVLAQESNSPTGSGLSGLASLAGINLGSSSGELISPKLYKSIATSIPFLRKMVEVPIQTSQSSNPITYKEYCNKYQKTNALDIVKKYTIGLPGVIVGAFSSEEKETVTSANMSGDSLQVYRVTKEEKDIFYQKMRLSKSKSMSHFLRKCVLEKEIYIVDLEPFRSLQYLLANATNNINQIAKQANTTGIIYKNDIQSIRDTVDDLSREIWQIHNLLLKRAEETGGE